jgi:hypothetical protein
MQPSHGLLFAATAAMLVAMLAAVAWLGGQLQETRIRNQSMAADLRALRQREAAQSLPQTALPLATQPAPEFRNVPGNPDEGALSRRVDLEQARADLVRARAG